MKPSRLHVHALLCFTLVLSLASMPVNGRRSELSSDSVKADSAKTAIVPQTKCPVMGGEIDKKVCVDIEGYRVYACCAGCLDKIKADPDKYLNKIRAWGETPEKAPIELCTKCGQIKGGAECCKELQKRCSKCGLVKGSPGCCRIPESAEGGIYLCPKCGEIMGLEKCCKAEGRERCEKCGLFKGSPGCCKIEKQKHSQGRQ